MRNQLISSLISLHSLHHISNHLHPVYMMVNPKSVLANWLDVPRVSLSVLRSPRGYPGGDLPAPSGPSSGHRVPAGVPCVERRGRQRVPVEGEVPKEGIPGPHFSNSHRLEDILLLVQEEKKSPQEHESGT